MKHTVLTPMINSHHHLLAQAIELTPPAPIDWEDMEAWSDDDWVDRKDALDCECVPFDTIEVGLSTAMWERDLIDSGHFEDTRDIFWDRDWKTLKRHHEEWPEEDRPW